jgi:hypothetical protein
MPKSSRQAKLERKAAKRKKQKQQPRGGSGSTPGRRAQVLQAATWPLMECRVNETWRNPMQLTQVVVARRNQSTGEVAAAAFLVDRACLGVKNALVANFPTAQTYRSQFAEHFVGFHTMVQVELDLAAAIIQAGLDYAASLEFRPHRDYAEAALLLGDADPLAVVETIPVGGLDGKPYFVAGPYDNPTRVMKHLERLLGRGNFYFTAPLDPDFGEFLAGETGDWAEISDSDDDDDLADDVVADDVVVDDDVAEASG